MFTCMRRSFLFAFLGLIAFSTYPAMLRAAEPVTDEPNMPKPPEFVHGSWSLVLLPDVQNYSDQTPGLFTLQTHWIVKNKDKYNILYVLTLGDFTNGDSDREWRNVQESMEELDGQVPYVLVTGNHDYTPMGNSLNGTTGLNRWFPISKFKEWPTLGGTMKADDITNSYHLFSAGGADWIILALQWAPTDEVVQWANDILAKYPNRKAILVTHGYLNNADCSRYDYAEKKDTQSCPPQAYFPAEAPINDGEQLWQKLVCKKTNVVLVCCGHSSGAAFITSLNEACKPVHQMLADYQDRKLGGEGVLRVLEFLPDGKTVQVKSFSPLYNDYLADPANQFSFELAQ